MTNPAPQISREAAHTIAAAHINHDCAVGGNIRVGKVLSYDEIKTKPPNIYNFPAEVLKGFWIAFVKNTYPFMLKSSTVLLVSKETGEIAYVGSSHDEG